MRLAGVEQHIAERQHQPARGGLRLELIDFSLQPRRLFGRLVPLLDGHIGGHVRGIDLPGAGVEDGERWARRYEDERAVGSELQAVRAGDVGEDGFDFADNLREIEQQLLAEDGCFRVMEQKTGIRT